VNDSSKAALAKDNKLLGIPEAVLSATKMLENIHFHYSEYVSYFLRMSYVGDRLDSFRIFVYDLLGVT
jgi:hypothetical protein